jgi:hypothetical protein
VAARARTRRRRRHGDDLPNAHTERYRPRVVQLAVAAERSPRSLGWLQYLRGGFAPAEPDRSTATVTLVRSVLRFAVNTSRSGATTMTASIEAQGMAFCAVGRPLRTSAAATGSCRTRLRSGTVVLQRHTGCDTLSHTAYGTAASAAVTRWRVTGGSARSSRRQPDCRRPGGCVTAG